MRAIIISIGLTMGLLGTVQTAHAVPFDRVTVRLGRAEPLLAVPSTAPAPVAIAPRAKQRRERAA
ncbi:hypothetical protein [Roseiterribacter gracilis]